jgi:hypothetical protein
MDYLEIINDLLERYPKYKEDIKIKIKGNETPDELRQKYLRLQDAIRTNAKPWIDPKDRVYEIVKSTVNKKLNEGKPCWKGYEQIGMKDKNGKQVPNCVPIKK